MSVGDAHAAIQGGIGFANDTLRGLFFDSGTEVLLLKPTEDAERDFDVFWQITSKWIIEFDNFKQQFVLEISDNSTDLEDNIPQATHVQAGRYVYEVSRKDTMPPEGFETAWHLFCRRTTQRATYTAL